MRPTWDQYFGLITQTVALRSDDAETRVGAVIVDKNNRIVSTGYNGTPMGTNLPKTRPEKYPFMNHAENNAILFSKCDLDNCKIYILGMLPCDCCARMIIQSGIKEVIIVNAINRTEGANWNFDSTWIMFQQVNMVVRFIEVPVISIA